MIPKPFDDIEKTDIEALLENKVSEGRSIEYKASLPGGSDGDKKEFLADVSSFANAGGGDLLYGVREVDGMPSGLVGLEGNMDSEKLRLENIVRDNLEPRIPGLRMRPVDGFEKGPVLLIRVPRSWAAPHMVKFGKSTRFFTRNSAGKHQMDITEIRASFLLSEALPERMKRFRDERLGRIIADETPVPLCEGAKMVLHILPVTSFMSESSLNMSVLKEHALSLRPIRGRGTSRFNLDGYVTYSSILESGSSSYCQIFRFGQIESVATAFVAERDGRRYIPSVAYEDYVIAAVLNHIGVLQALEISCPLLIFLCFEGVSGVYMGLRFSFFRGEDEPIDRDTLILPEILVENYTSLSNNYEVAKILRPAFDAVWNACGFERSFNYDADGNWNPRK